MILSCDRIDPSLGLFFFKFNPILLLDKMKLEACGRVTFFFAFHIDNLAITLPA